MANDGDSLNAATGLGRNEVRIVETPLTANAEIADDRTHQHRYLRVRKGVKGRPPRVRSRTNRLNSAPRTGAWYSCLPGDAGNDTGSIVVASHFGGVSDSVVVVRIRGSARSARVQPIGLLLLPRPDQVFSYESGRQGTGGPGHHEFRLPARLRPPRVEERRPRCTQPLVILHCVAHPKSRWSFSIQLRRQGTPDGRHPPATSASPFSPRLISFPSSVCPWRGFASDVE